MEVILESKDVNKNFGAVTAAENISVQFKKDAVVGLIGIIVALSGGGQAAAALTGGKIGALRGLALIPFFALPLVYFLFIVYFSIK